MEKFPNNADRRRAQAEQDDKISLSHWLGELHAHSKSDVNNPELPDDILEYRRGSNCGDVPLRALIDYHGQEMENQFIAITEHARDADPAGAIKGITDWFMGMYLSNSQWLHDNYLKNKDELTESELAEIKTLSKTKAEQVALYGDERIEEVFREIDSIKNNRKIRIFKGIETSLMPDGSLDTDMVEKSRFDSVNCSIHPDIDKNAFQDIIADPNKYSELAIKGIENPKVNIISHIGEGAKTETLRNLRWESLAESCLKNQTALEINLKKLITYIYKETLNYEKYPKNDISYRQDLVNKLDELTPILGDNEIGERLKKYFPLGLKIAINTDEHKNKFIKSKTDKTGTEYSFIPRDLRYWRALKIVEDYFNDKFTQLNIKKENIINSLTPNELENFLKKKK